MAVEQTLLNYITQKYTNRHEDVAVDALGLILSRSEAARQALTELLRDGDAAIGTITKVRTQLQGEDGARPDLACFDEHDAESALVEAKFWAKLTENQPNNYLDRLPEDAPSALLFVAPANRLSSLWAELQQRLANGNIQLGQVKSNENFQSASVVGGQRRLMTASWAVVLDRMTERANAAGDTQATIDLDQLRGLASREDDEAFLPLRPGEINQEIPRRVIDLRRLVDDIIAAIANHGWGTLKGGKRATTDDTITFYGRMIYLDDNEAWFGINHEDWAKRGNTPLWLELYSSETRSDDELARRLDRLESTYPGQGMDDDWHIPIHLPTGEEYEAVRDSVVARLEHIARLITGSDV